MRLDSDWVADHTRKWTSPEVRDRLARAIRDIELRSAGESRHTIDPDWGIDSLAIGSIHELFAAADPVGSSTGAQAPRAILVHLARVAIRARPQQSHAPSGSLIWIGRAGWPCPAVIPDLLPRSIWIDPPDTASRLWAIDLALRSGGVAAVIADGCGLDMGSSRRLQLAAEAGRTIGLLARPTSELSVLSAATTRWRISPATTLAKHPRWTVELLRCKGVRPASDASHTRCVVEWHHAQGARRVSPEMAGGTRAAEGASGSDRWLAADRIAG